jgi:hypothetical protein
MLEWVYNCVSLKGLLHKVHIYKEYYTDKKEKKIFLISEEIQKGLGAKSYMRKGFLIYEEVRKYLITYEEAVSHI